MKKRTKRKSKPTSKTGQCGEIDQRVDSDAPDADDDEVDATLAGESPLPDSKSEIDVEKDCEQTPSPKATMSITTPLKNRAQSNLDRYFHSPK